MAYKKPADRVKNRDPRQTAFKQYYIDPNSPTFSNVKGSAIRAGFSELYADNLTAQQPAWLADLMRDTEMMRAEMLALAERNLRSVVIKPEPEDKDDKKIWYKANEYVSGTLGRAVYSTRQEVTGADGRAIFANEERDKAKTPLASLFKGVSPTEKA